MPVLTRNHRDWFGGGAQGRAIVERAGWRNSTGSFRGEATPYGASRYDSGILPEPYLNWWMWDAPFADYVVWSYRTPIAWHTESGWVVPPVSYSVTTTGHQGVVRRALGVHWDDAWPDTEGPFPETPRPEVDETLAPAIDSAARRHNLEVAAS